MIYLDYVATNEHHGNEIALLLSEGVEQEKIRAWCKKNIPYGLVEYCSLSVPENVSPCEGWEAGLTMIARVFAYFGELTPWESASAEFRTAHGMKVAKLARELADVLEEKPNPHYPPVLGLFDEDKAVAIIKTMPEETSRDLLKNTKYGEYYIKHGEYLIHNSEHSYDNNAAYHLSRKFFLESQEFPDLLRRLADHAEKAIYLKKRTARPNTGNANARVFAVHVANGMKQFFNRTPNEIIAACVCLKYPELEQPPNADTIRDWRGAK